MLRARITPEMRAARVPDDHPDLVALLAQIQSGMAPMSRLIDFLKRHKDDRAVYIRNILVSVREYRRWSLVLQPRQVKMTVAGIDLYVPLEAFA